MPDPPGETRRILYHYTDRAGYNSIRATVSWCFKAKQPRRRDSDHPRAAYFTSLGPETTNLAVKISVPTRKLRYVFIFEDSGDLTPLRGDRSRRILYSEHDYIVIEDRQIGHGEVRGRDLREPRDEEGRHDRGR